MLQLLVQMQLPHAPQKQNRHGDRRTAPERVFEPIQMDHAIPHRGVWQKKREDTPAKASNHSRAAITQTHSGRMSKPARRYSPGDYG